MLIIAGIFPLASLQVSVYILTLMLLFILSFFYIILYYMILVFLQSMILKNQSANRNFFIGQLLVKDTKN